ncbi:citryl-CoA lyase [Pseudonocardia ailaonensis]|uniref:citrate synthase (unknown stereospecificity) n=1 Tax=Pseudonocardia ailaonensis TaxID=367279 RepID=A0ABN2NB63_9PSEU
MPQADINHWETAIAEVLPDDVVVRGRRLTDILGKLSFAEMVYLVLTGSEATPGQARVLEALLVSVVDHGISPSSMLTRMYASYGVPIQVAIAGGELAFGDYHGGTSQQIGEELSSLVVAASATPGDLDRNLRTTAARHVAESREAKQRVLGFGHPQHDVDPRVPILLRIAAEEGVAGLHTRLVSYLETELAQSLGRRVPASFQSVSAALALDLGIDHRAARALIISPRAIGLAAHFLEEVDQGHRIRNVSGGQVTYTGRACESNVEEVST